MEEDIIVDLTNDEPNTSSFNQTKAAAEQEIKKKTMITLNWGANSTAHKQKTKSESNKED